MSDLDAIKKLVEPLADKAGIFRSRVLAMVTEDNVRDIYGRVGPKGVRAAAEAIIRIGETRKEEKNNG